MKNKSPIDVEFVKKALGASEAIPLNGRDGMDLYIEGKEKYRTTSNDLPKFFDKFHSDISWIKTNTILLVKHGSHAYGTNIATSDEDFRGLCVPPKEYFHGYLKKFEQAQLKEPDTTIFDIRKFFNLAADCNPNCLEILFVDPKDIIYCNDLGQKLIDNRDLFLSKKVKFTLAGYSYSQIKRIKSHRQWLLYGVKQPPSRTELGLPEHTLIPQDQLMAIEAQIKKELDKFNFDFLSDLSESSKIEIKNIMSNMLAQLNIMPEQHWEKEAHKLGLDDKLIYVMQKEREYLAKKREYDQYQNWLTTRNPARAKLEAKFGYDSKNALHLVRLLRMCKELLTTGKLNVKRPDAQELLEIRNGAWTYDQLLEFADKEEKELNELYLISNVLPKSCDRNKLDKLCIEIIESSLERQNQ